MNLGFEAGRVAGAKGWDDAVTIHPREIGLQSPQGAPVLVEATVGTVGIEEARAVAALHAAGRSCVVVSEGAVPHDVAEWLPAECLYVVGRPLAPNGSAAAATHDTSSASSVLDAYEVDMYSWVDPRAGDSELLAATPVTLNWDIGWWMIGDRSLHLPDGPGEWGFERSDPLARLDALFALPFRVGECNVLGIVTLEGQWFPEADALHVIDGTCAKRGEGLHREFVEIDLPGSRGFNCSTVGMLIDRHEGLDPDPLFPNDKEAKDLFANVIRGMLDGITRGILEHGNAGFSVVKPQLAAWIQQRQADAVEALT